MFGNTKVKRNFNMTKLCVGNQRRSTIIRNNRVHEVHAEILEKLGDVAPYVSKSYIYEQIHAATGLCTKTIAHILNHTTHSDDALIFAK